MIPTRNLKECSEELAPILTIIFNRTLQTGNVPEDWKSADISAVFKKGQRYDPANYCPVSWTCLCCKMLEHFIVSSVMKHVNHHQILSDCQHGFQARRSSEIQLSWHLHWTEVTKQILWGSSTDLVQNKQLLRKLHHYGIRGHRHS